MQLGAKRWYWAAARVPPAWPHSWRARRAAACRTRVERSWRLHLTNTQQRARWPLRITRPAWLPPRTRSGRQQTTLVGTAPHTSSTLATPPSIGTTVLYRSNQNCPRLRSDYRTDLETLRRRASKTRGIQREKTMGRSNTYKRTW